MPLKTKIESTMDCTLQFFFQRKRMADANCSQCRSYYTSVSRRFYCCDKKKSVCLFCKKKVCSKCKKIRNNQLASARCKSCYAFSRKDDDSDMFYEHQCDNFFCGKCLLKARKKGDQIILVCGHTTSIKQWETFMQQFCSKCGQAFDPFMDYQLTDHRKICFRCFRTHKKQINRALLRCISCQEIIRNGKEAGHFNQELIICKICFRESAMEENNIQRHYERKEEEPKIKLGESVKKKQGIDEVRRRQIYEDSGDFRHPEKGAEIKLDSQIKNHGLKRASEAGEENFVFEEPVIIGPPNKIQDSQPMQNNQPFSEKNQQKNSVQDKKNGQKPVISKLECSEVHKMVNGSMVRMKKSFSNETYVENLKIDMKQDDEEYTECSSCSYELPLKCTLKEQKSPINSQPGNLCRLCYMVKNSNNSLLGFSNRNGTQTNVQRGKHVSSIKYSGSPKRGVEKHNDLVLFGTTSKNQLLEKLYKKDVSLGFSGPGLKRDNYLPIKGSPTIPESKHGIGYGASVTASWSKKCDLCGKLTRTVSRTLYGKELCPECYLKRHKKQK